MKMQSQMTLFLNTIYSLLALLHSKSPVLNSVGIGLGLAVHQSTNDIWGG